MKRLVMMLVAFLLVGTGAMFAQEDTRAARKAAKEAEKAAREAAEMQAFETAKKAIFDKDFVLEADRVEFKRGNFKYVTPSTNFVSLINGKATVQLSFDGAFAGPNGIGGITVEGTPSNVEVETDKKGNVNCSFSVQGIGISAQVFINMSSGNNNASVSISPNFNNNNLTLNGNIVPLDQSNIFKGRAW